MELFKHNQEAYEKVIEAFKTKQRVAVVHATGTGKSYIIAAVSEHFNRVCVIAPNLFVLEETKKVCKKDTTFVTYSTLLARKGNIGSFDLIVLDEFHRSGADKWGEAVRTFIENNPNAHVLGTSATHVRYLDNMRDMAVEIFNGDIVSYISLSKAMSEGILPTPTYVTALYSISKDIRNIRKKVNESNASDEWKKNMLNRIRSVSSNWENSNGVSRIIRKYIRKDTKRVIVFCSSVEESRKTMKLLSNWFYAADFKKVKIFKIDYSSENYMEQMGMFQQNDDSIKIAVSVNMLNEGVHVPNVDAVIMLRTTTSRIIVEQQIGRCLNTGNRDITPVVLDLCNNIDIVTEVPSVIEQIVSDSVADVSNIGNKEQDAFQFSIIDESKNIRDILNEFISDISGATWSKQKELIDEFYKSNGHLPSNIEDSTLHRWWYLVLKNGEQEQKEWVYSRGGKLVRQKKNFYDGMSAEEFLNEEIRIGKQYGTLSRMKIHVEKDVCMLKKARLVLGKLPIDNEIYIRHKELEREYGIIKDAKYWYDLAVEMYKKDGKLSKLVVQRINENKKSGSWNSEYTEKLKELGYVSKNECDRENYERVVSAVESLGRWPNKGDIDNKDFIKVNYFFGTSEYSEKLRSNYPDLYERLSKYRNICRKRMSNEECYSVIKAFINKYKFIPPKRDREGKYTTPYLAYRAVIRDIDKNGYSAYIKERRFFDNMISVLEKYRNYSPFYLSLVSFRNKYQKENK